MCTYIDTQTCISIHIHIYIYIYIYTYVYVYLHICMYSYKYIYIHNRCKYLHACLDMYAYIHVHKNVKQPHEAKTVGLRCRCAKLRSATSSTPKGATGNWDGWTMPGPGPAERGFSGLLGGTLSKGPCWFIAAFKEGSRKLYKDEPLGCRGFLEVVGLGSPF